MRNVTAIRLVSVILAIVMVLSVSSCSKKDSDTNETEIADTTESETTAEKVDYSASDIIGTYQCHGEVYDMFIEDSEDYIPYFSFDGNGNCTVLIYNGEGLTYVGGTYAVKEKTVNVKLDLRFSRVWDYNGQTRYMDDEFVFEIVDAEHLTIGNGFYDVNDGDSFEKIDNDFKELPENSQIWDFMGKYYCSSDKFESVDDAPYIYLGKEGLCALSFVYNNSRREVVGKYTRSFNYVVVSDMDFLNEGMEDIDTDSIPNKFMFTFVDNVTLTIDNGFYDVSDGDRFVKEEACALEELTSNVGKTYNEIISEYDSYQHLSLSGPNVSYKVYGEDETYALYFFGSQTGENLEDVGKEHGDEIKCAGVYTQVKSLFPMLSESPIPIVEFLSSLGIPADDRYKVVYWNGWFWFNYQGYVMQINTGVTSQELYEMPDALIDGEMVLVVMDEAIDNTNFRIVYPETN